MVLEIDEIKFVEGLEQLSNAIRLKPSFRAKLIKAQEIGNLDFLKNYKNIKKEFDRTRAKLSLTFTFEAAGKILASSANDAESIIKVLCDFYKEGIFAVKVFESPAGRIKNKR